MTQTNSLTRGVFVAYYRKTIILVAEGQLHSALTNPSSESLNEMLTVATKIAAKNDTFVDSVVLPHVAQSETPEDIMALFLMLMPQGDKSFWYIMSKHPDDVWINDEPVSSHMTVTAKYHADTVAESPLWDFVVDDRVTEITVDDFNKATFNTEYNTWVCNSSRGTLHIEHLSAAFYDSILRMSR
tara:strand:+ start:6618 stop:7172 length:555 start_codon:yes stop_codon:yes gene_type:complete